MKRRNKILSPHQKIENSKVNTMKFSLESNYPTFPPSPTIGLSLTFMDRNARNQTEAEHISLFSNVPCRITRTPTQMRVLRAAVHAYTMYVFTGNFYCDNRQVSALIQKFNSLLAHEN